MRPLSHELLDGGAERRAHPAPLVGFRGAFAIVLLFLGLEGLLRGFPDSGPVLSAWFLGRVAVVPCLGLLQAIRILWHARHEDDHGASTIAAVLVLATSLYSFLSAIGPT